jgi:hypothetical protein
MSPYEAFNCSDGSWKPPASLRVRRCWLPVWLPEIYLSSLMFERAKTVSIAPWAAAVSASQPYDRSRWRSCVNWPEDHLDANEILLSAAKAHCCWMASKFPEIERLSRPHLAWCRPMMAPH